MNFIDLGQVALLKISSVPPTNTKLLWYDTNIGVGQKIKYYETANGTWQLITSTVTNFKDLNDVPHDYTGQAGKMLVVKQGADGIEFIDIPKETFTSDFLVSLPDGKNFLKWVSGDLVPAAGKTAIELLEEGAVEAIPPTLTLTTPTTVQFNQTAISNVLNFTKVINSLGGAVQSVSLQWRRNNTGAWVELTSDVNLSTFTHTLTDTNFNTQPFNYRYIVTDNKGGTATVTRDIIPIAYNSPSKNLILSGNVTTREKGNVNSTFSGTITRNSPFVNLVRYRLYYKADSNPWTAAGPWTTISGASATINVTHNDVALVNANTISYVIDVEDEYATSTSNQININYVYKAFLGYSTASILTLSQILGLANPTLSNSKARTVTGVTTNDDEYAYIAYRAQDGDLSSIIQDGATPVLLAFTKLADVSGVNSFGANVTYRIYKTNDLKAFTNATLAYN